jgi:hypothetical protein
MSNNIIFRLPEDKLEGESSLLSPFDIKSKIESSLIQLLQKRFASIPQKQTIMHSTVNFKIACPYCGDSKKDFLKKRGLVYPSTGSYYCFNCSTSKKLSTLFSDFFALDPQFYDQLDSLVQAKPQFTSFSFSKKISSTPNFDKLVSRNDFKKNKYLKEVSESSFITEYLKSRHLLEQSFNFLWSDYFKQLFIFNLCEDRILGYQIRNFNEGVPKYMTYNLRYMYGKMKSLFSCEEKDISKFFPLSMLFGISKINLNHTITLFEGPLDSLLFPNSIGLASVKNDVNFTSIVNKRYFLDFDEAGYNQSFKLIKRGDSVFLWKKFFKEHPMPLMYKSKVDLNDLIVYFKSNSLPLPDFESYFSYDKLDAVWI